MRVCCASNILEQGAADFGATPRIERRCPAASHPGDSPPRNPLADFLQFTCTAEVPLECFCGCFGVQVRPKSLTCPARASPRHLESTLPVQVNCRSLRFVHTPVIPRTAQHYSSLPEPPTMAIPLFPWGGMAIFPIHCMLIIS